jgi:hypothetical protein
MLHLIYWDAVLKTGNSERTADLLRQSEAFGEKSFMLTTGVRNVYGGRCIVLQGNYGRQTCGSGRREKDRVNSRCQDELR